MKKSIKTILIIILTIIIVIFFSRLITPTEIDDVHPERYCEQKYLEKADTLWIMPKYLNIPISENKVWCEKILLMDKTIGMHGITHTYHEFEEKINEKDLKEAKQIFEDCFGYEPTLFKAPNLALSKENKKLLEENDLEIKGIMNQNLHKVYHCKDSGILPNWFHDLF